MDKQSLEIRTRQWYEIILEANSSSLSKKEWCIKKRACRIKKSQPPK